MLISSKNSMAISSIFCRILLTCLTALLLYNAAPANSHPPSPSQNWINHGGDLHNTRNARNEVLISPATASKLTLKWKFATGKSISATPAIYDGVVYFPSWDGYVYAVGALDGSLVWKTYLPNETRLAPSKYNPRTNYTVARATPTVAGSLLIVGIYGPAVVVALRRTTGRLVWLTALDDHPAGVITMSGTYFEGGFYVGTSSQEELAAIEKCCSFRGGFSKLDARTGKIGWTTYMLPDNNGELGRYAGAAIWGSSPAIDIRRKLVYIATGNLYSVPPEVQECQEKENNQTAPDHPESCIGPDIHSESILGLELGSGSIRWSHQIGGYDVWFLACYDLSKANCPPGPNPDADFGEAPMMLTIRTGKAKQDIVAATQKSGFAWALNRATGDLVWSTEAGPGGFAGGGTWGSATDQTRVYTNIANANFKNFTLKPSTRNITAGGWVAMDANTGKVLWSTANPTNATAPGPVTVANGVLFGGSGDKNGTLFAMDAKSGLILWSYKTGASVFGGPSVSGGCVYTGSGYFGSYTPGTSVFAFCVTQ